MKAPALNAHALAKINLFLHVTGVRDDGYHTLQSLVVFSEFLKDTISIQKSDHFKIDITGYFAPTIMTDPIEKNLVYRAHHAIEKASGHRLPCHITLDKNIPIGAGLGGGSSDASATIKLLMDCFDLELPQKELDNILVGLGADVPVCFSARPSYFSNIGDIVVNAPAIPKFHMVLVWPNVHTATKDVFTQRQGNFSNPIDYPVSFNGLYELLSFLKNCKNDLSHSSKNLYPEIKTAYEFMERQKGCLLSRMTGSGSTIFGIFEHEHDAKIACKNVQNQTKWWASYGVVGV